MPQERDLTMEFYTHEKITPSTTKITNVGDVFCFLVEGNDSAMLIDAGIGAGNLRDYVEKLTSKPVSVLLTHGHCDHAGAAGLFETVYLNQADWELASRHAGIEMRKSYLSFVLGEAGRELTDESMCPDRTAGYLPLTAGQIFRLGGITLEAVAVPGHTQGMTCVLNQEEGSILFGDACNPNVFLWGEESSSVEEYLETLENLKRMEDRYDTVYLSHAVTSVDKSILDGVMEVCRQIISGKDDGIPYSFMDYKGLKLAKNVTVPGIRTDGGLGNIVYNPANIFRKKN